MKYRKKPVITEAVQLNWKNWNAVCDLMGSIVSPSNPARESAECSDPCGETAPFIELTIPTPLGNGTQIAKHGDFIVKGRNNEFSLWKPNIFTATYEPADAAIWGYEVREDNSPNAQSEATIWPPQRPYVDPRETFPQVGRHNG